MDEIRAVLAEVRALDTLACPAPWRFEPHWGNIYDRSSTPFRCRRGPVDDVYEGAAIIAADGDEVFLEGSHHQYDALGGYLGDEEDPDVLLVIRARTLLPRLAAALEVAVEDLEREFPCTCHEGWTERGMHGKECAWDTARDILSRIAAALSGEEAP